MASLRCDEISEASEASDCVCGPDEGTAEADEYVQVEIVPFVLKLAMEGRHRLEDMADE